MRPPRAVRRRSARQARRGSRPGRPASGRPGDWAVVDGLLADQLPPLPRGLGVEVAGTVDALGEGVIGVETGDRVFGPAAFDGPTGGADGHGGRTVRPKWITGKPQPAPPAAETGPHIAVAGGAPPHCEAPPPQSGAIADRSGLDAGRYLATTDIILVVITPRVRPSGLISDHPV
ncbi:alcohol dehydrogenase catalytic domain-containing protein [Streptomyces sp. NPDC015032]|uniref:alcohol dehydrogenase catalytic domain-containing protein n=1 Tax=Streptomyces sp. NPDC015032 TaxID=3364937 RepID=UPI0036FA83F0